MVPRFLIRPLSCLAALVLSAAPGRAEWLPEGVPLCTSSGAQSSARAVSDGAGGAIVAWVDLRSGSQDVYAQRVLADGGTAWTVNGVAICTAAGAQLAPAIVTDGSGGAIVVWQDARNGAGNPDLYAQRVSAVGAVQWTANGIVLCSAAGVQGHPCAITDGAGGAIVAWEDQRNGSNTDLYAQRLDPTGAAQWAANGVVLCAAQREQTALSCASDGQGGLLAAWEDTRVSDMVSDIFAQRLGPAGSGLWAANGLQVTSRTGLRLAYAPDVVDDGSGGALVAWEDYRNAVDAGIYGLRVTAAGAKAAGWDTAGSALCDPSGNQTAPLVVTDGAGGAIAVWVDDRNGSKDLYAQRVGPAAARLWVDAGVPVCTASQDQAGAQSVPDGAGGVLVTWYDFRYGASTDIYAQRITGAGLVADGWTANGVPVCTARSDQQSPTLVGSGDGGTVVAWQDYRDSLSYDIYASRVIGSGGPLAVSALLPPDVRLGEPVPNPALGMTRLVLDLPSPREVRAAIFDLSGRRIRSLLPGGALPAGTHRLAWDGSDDSGTPVPAGVYYARVEAGGPALVRRLVRLR